MNFDDVYNSYVDIVYSYLRQRLKDQYLIEDIIQDTFYSVYRGLNKVTKKGSIKSWILTIAHHRMVDHLRKENHKTLSIDDKKIEEINSNTFPEEKVGLTSLLKKLDYTSRLIIYGIYVLELRYRDLSEILNIPEGTVKSKAYYARQQLKEWLSEGKDYDE